LERLKYEIPVYVVLIALMIYGVFLLNSAVDLKDRILVFKQMAWNVAAVLSMILFTVLRINDLRLLGRYVYIVSVILMSLVLIFGVEINGARRWFNFGLFSFQPSELMKVGLVLLLPQFLMRKKYRDLLTSLLLTLGAILLAMMEPDLGSAVLFMFIWFVLIFMRGIWDRFLLWTMGIGGGFAPVIFFYVLKDYQRERILAFLNPKAHFTGAGYNVLQAMKAIGSGGFLGRGYGLGFMNKAGYVPMDKTDFIISVAGEELGFVGILILIALYTLLFISIYRIFRISRSLYEELVISGVMAVFFFHVFENLGMSMGLLPVTGIPLPFVSYGGSSTITFGILISIVLKVSMGGTRAKPLGMFEGQIKKGGEWL